MTIMDKEQMFSVVPYKAREKSVWEDVGIYKGYHWAIAIHSTFGPQIPSHRCGYVKLNSAAHPWEDYEHSWETPCQVHGGLTYAELDSKNRFWVGFDCAHSWGDNPIEKCDQENFEFVKAECFSIIEQAEEERKAISN